jgi:NADH oxidase (H2O-forming)
MNTLQKKDDNTKLWRCIICGEIFEGTEPPEICPTCGVGREEFELYEEEKVEYTSGTRESIVIIGNNAAGISAAESIRKRNENVNIVIVDKDPNYAYYRPSLSDYISNSHDEDYFYLHNGKWYDENNITLKLGIAVTKIDKINKKIVLEKGEKISYDKLILATGSHNFIPPIEGISKKGVFTIKTLADADNVKEYASKCKKVIIIGAGLLGLEAGWELKKLGLDVSIIEMASRILPKQLDQEGAKVFEKGIDKTGISIYKGVTAESILGSDAVTGVKLDNETMIEAEMVIVSSGVRPNIQLAKDIDIDVDKGILVNENMETSEKNIYACGDVAEFHGINYLIWAQAVKQGEVAGANAVGDLMAYENIVPSNIFNGMDMTVFSIGNLGVDEQLSYKSVMYQDIDKCIYRKLYFVNDKFVGGILIGDISKTSHLINGYNQGYNYRSMVEKVIL